MAARGAADWWGGRRIGSEGGVGESVDGFSLVKKLGERKYVMGKKAMGGKMGERIWASSQTHGQGMERRKMISQ